MLLYPQQVQADTQGALPVGLCDLEESMMLRGPETDRDAVWTLGQTHS